jgi:hypothetical protein
MKLFVLVLLAFALRLIDRNDGEQGQNIRALLGES